MSLCTWYYLIHRYGLRDAWHAWRCGRALRKAIKKRGVELPHLMLCIKHGGSPECEETNWKYGFKCPRCG